MTEIIVRADSADLQRLRRKLKPQQLDRPLRIMFERMADIYFNHAKLRAPVDTGRLRSSLARGAANCIYELDRAVPPGWVRVGTPVVNDQGKSYPAILDTSPRHHYRGGGAQGLRRRATSADIGALKGKPTRGWFSGVANLVQEEFAAEMERAARLIKRQFG